MRNLRHRITALLLLPTLAGMAAAAEPDIGSKGSDKTDDDKFTAITRGNGLSLHKNNYVLPATWSEEYQGDATEVIFQLSIKQRLFINNLYAGYTQKAFWQAYNHDISAPFRETNYNPEIFYRWLPGDDMFRQWHLDRWGFDAGIEHESNGKPLPGSRSINRAYFAPFRASSDGKDLLYLKAWYRFPENEKNGPTDPGGDDNPDYYRYFGYTQLEYLHYFENQLMIYGMTRGNLSTGKGALELRLSVPASGQTFFWVVDLFSGYGESLIDYNHDTTRIGVGVMFNR